MPHPLYPCTSMTSPYSAIDGSWPDLVTIYALLSVAVAWLRRYPHCEEDTRMRHRSGGFRFDALPALSIYGAIHPRGNWRFIETFRFIALIVGHICGLGLSLKQLFRVESELYGGISF
jgi:hypothetical protein